MIPIGQAPHIDSKPVESLTVPILDQPIISIVR